MRDESYKQTSKYLMMKADQEWEMAGLARQDGDMKASEQHTANAREYQRKAGEARASE